MPLSAIAARRLAIQKQAAVAKQEDVQSKPENLSQLANTLKSPKKVTSDSQIDARGKRSRKRQREGPASKSQPQSRTEAKVESGSNSEPSVSLDAKAAANVDEVPKSSISGHRLSSEAGQLAAQRIIHGNAVQTADNDRLEPSEPERVTASETEEEYSEADNPVFAKKSYPRITTPLSTISGSSVEYRTENGMQSAIIQLRPGETVIALGQYDLWIRKGTVTLLGAVLHSSSKLHRIHAPSTHALPVIKAVQNPYMGGDSSAEVVLISYHTGIRRLRRVHPNFSRLWNDSQLCQSRTFQVLISNSPELGSIKRPMCSLQAPPQWQALATMLMDPKRPKPSVVAICGPKGSGKSTLSRFLSNALLCSQRYKAIAYLDIDPGQPEFGAPGDISLCVLKDYNFGVPFTHPTCTYGENESIWKHHFGFITARDDPEHYLTCVLNLYMKHRSTCAAYPLIINFSGWVMGSGLDYLGSLIAGLSPTDVVYMSIDGPKEVLEALEQNTKQTGSQLHILPSIITEFVQRTSADLRAMQTLSYFHMDDPEAGQMHWDARPLHAMREQVWSYAGPNQYIDAITLYNDEINPQFFEYVIDGSVLAVVIVDDDEDLSEALMHDRKSRQADREEHTNSWNEQTGHLSDESEVDDSKAGSTLALPGIRADAICRTKEDLPYYFPGNGAYQPLDPAKSKCLGQVLLRKIDVENKCLRVITPLSNSMIESYKARGTSIVLVRGRLDQPAWAYLEPYHDGLACEQEYEYYKQQSRALGLEAPRSIAHATKCNAWEPEDEDDRLAFDVEAWAAKTPYVKIVKPEDSEVRKRQKAWRVRRNLETGNGR